MNLKDYMKPKKQKQWKLVQCKVDKILAEKFRKQLDKDGFTVTAFVEAAMCKYLDEKKS